MKSHPLPARTVAFAICLLGAGSAIADSAQPEAKDPLSDYLADLSPGAISAGEMLGLSASAITSVQTPKDFVAALSSLNTGAGKDGFGLSFTPARTRFAPVSIGDYTERPLSRLWGGTTFSYAQKTLTQSGVDYRQDAVALHVSYYLDAKDDPAAAAAFGFRSCKAVVDLMSEASTEQNKAFDLLVKAGVDPEAANQRVRETTAKAKRLKNEGVPAAKACVDTAVQQAKEKWNASQLALTVGEAWIQGSDASAARLSLGRMVAASAALGPNADSLVNLSLRHTNKALDLTTLSTTPAYKSSTLAGARWTYRAVDTKDLFGLAEVSNAKSSQAAASSNVFRYALGVDKRFFEGVWGELRIGRKLTADGTSEQTAVLMSLKLSPTSTLPRD